MPGVIRTHFLPPSAESADLTGGIAVIIDQLRASTTICAAIASGAAGVHPFLEPEHALQEKANWASIARGEPALLGGERGGILIPGFDLDNSPLRYNRATVEGKLILFTTTNGTRAVHAASRAASIHVGCLGNATAIADALAPAPHPIHLICAGTRDRVTQEDVLAAGAIATKLVERGRSPNLPVTTDDDDSTLIAMALWQATIARPNGIMEALLASRGGRNCARLGLFDDIAFCAKLDTAPVVPWLAPTGCFVNPDNW